MWNNCENVIILSTNWFDFPRKMINSMLLDCLKASQLTNKVKSSDCGSLLPIDVNISLQLAFERLKFWHSTWRKVVLVWNVVWSNHLAYYLLSRVRFYDCEMPMTEKSSKSKKPSLLKSKIDQIGMKSVSWI